ncbi:MAG: 1-phosphofructokinase family hexose kinase [Ruminococcaceae bacterium]|nr:1-phosphofructokinase family hexose kinase [Oscillospiraceae bacterium]
MAKIAVLMLNPSVDIMLEFDEFIKTKTNRVKESIRHMGGKGLNVSLVARSFGLSVCATGFIGRDEEAELAGMLKEADIENEFVVIEGVTRTNFKLLDKKEGSVTEVNGQGFNINKQKQAELEKVLDKCLRDVDILVLTGSLPEGIDVDFYAKCIDKANEKGIKTVLDASGEPLKLALLKKPYAIKPNIDELSELAGRPLNNDAQITEMIKKLLSDGTSMITVSMGEKGAFFAKDGKIVRAKAFDINFKSAVGAGDSMVGAICYSIANGETLERTARLGTSAGCITTSKPATNLCSAREVLANEERVEILEMVI